MAKRLLIIGLGVGALSSIGGLGFDERGRRTQIKVPTNLTAEEEVDRWRSRITYHSPGRSSEKDDLPNVMFIKPHKVGSSSMSNLLRVIATRNDGLEEEYLFTYDETHFFGRKERQPLQPGFHIWADHAFMSAMWENSVPEIIDKAFKLTLVREPIDRCLSAFYYYEFTRERTNLWEVPKEEMMQRKLDYKYCGVTSDKAFQLQEIGPRGVKSSVQETLEFYDLIGITGRYMETLTVLKMALDLRVGDMLFFDGKCHGVNNNSARPGIEDEPPEFIRHLKSIISPLDFELYHAADEKLSKQIKRLGPEFSAEYEKLVNGLTKGREACGRSHFYDTSIMAGHGCFVKGDCRLSCLNKFSAANGLWDV